MATNDFVRARIDPIIKEEAARVLSTMGLTVSENHQLYPHVTTVNQ